MKASQRIVTQIPLTELWTERGPVQAARVRLLSRSDLVLLLHAQAVHFVVADAGRSLRWVPEAECFSFWQDEVRDHLVAQPEEPIHLDSYPGEYAYVASQWSAPALTSRPIVLLERRH